jgi:hypothetical protein
VEYNPIVKKGSATGLAPIQTSKKKLKINIQNKILLKGLKEELLV